MPEPEPIPAATLIVFREGGGAPELLMVERAKTMSFAAGALVFPGGRIDPGDRTLAAAFSGDQDDLAARVAAIRETLEEAGIAIGIDPMPDCAVLQAVRRGLHARDPFGDLLRDRGLALRPDLLIPFARWLPRQVHLVSRRVFDTRFFLARLPIDAPEPVVDATENVRVFWRSAAEVLADCDAGHGLVIFPTRRNLERLALFASFDDAVADTITHPWRTITPHIAEIDGVAHLCIPDDLGYPIASEELTSSVRG